MNIVGLTAHQIFVYALLFSVSVLVIILIINYYFQKIRKNIDLEKAEMYLKNKEYSKAIEYSEKYLKNNPFDYTPIYYIAKSFEGLGKYIEAIEQYEKVLVRIPIVEEDLKNSIILRVADLYHQKKKFQEAIGYYNIISGNKKYESDVLYYLAEIYYEIEAYMKAKEKIDLFIKVVPRHVKGRLLMSKIYNQLGLYERAIKSLEVIVSSEVVDRIIVDEANIVLSDCFIKTGKFDLAINILEECIKNPDLAETVFLKLINSYLGNKYINKALFLVEEQTGKISFSNIVIAKYSIAQKMWLMKEYYSAIEIWYEIYKLDPDFKDVKNIYNKYKGIMNNPHYKNFFSNNERLNDEFIKNIFRLRSDVDLKNINNNKIFFSDNKNDIFIINTKIEKLKIDDLNLIYDYLSEKRLLNGRIKLYSYLPVPDEVKNSKLYTGIVSVVKDEFIEDFNKKYNDSRLHLQSL